MKKIALILAFLIIPCSAFGLEMLNDNTMDSITGQSGVAIAFDDIQLFLNVGRFAYIDCDGFSTHNNFGGTCAGSGAAIVIENFQMDVININAIVAGGTQASYEYTGSGGKQTTGGGLPLASASCGQIPLFYDYGTGQGADVCTLDSAVTLNKGLGLDNYFNSNSNGASFHFKPLTIDVSMELPILTQGQQFNEGDYADTTDTVGGVLIGLPTAEFYIGQMILTPTVTSQISSNDLNHQARMRNDNESYGTFYMEDITFSVLSGWMEIAPTGNPNDNY